MGPPPFAVLVRGFTKMNSHQPELLQPEHLPTRLRWEKLFGFLPLPPDPEPTGRGRPPVPPSVLLKGLVYQRLSRLPFLRQLHTQLLENRGICTALGLSAYQPPPSLERFSAYLSDTANADLQKIRVGLVLELISLGVVQGFTIALDSCPIASWVRENNLKTNMNKRRWDKEHRCKGDPDARLGVNIHFPNPDKKRVDYFWGYRNHAIVDADAELPLWEITEPNSVGEVTVARLLLVAAKDELHLPVTAVLGDTEYDAEGILRYIQDEMKAEVFIPRNPRSIQDHNGFMRQGENVACPGGLSMNRKGRMTVNGITYVQYRCPFYYGRAPDLLMCPADHPKFTKQQGCNYLWRLTGNPRDRIPYHTGYFKEHYKQRTGIERAFSRLLAITLEEPSVRGLASIRNHCTISHIATLLVAKAAVKMGCADRCRFVRTFVPNLLRGS